MSRPEIPSPHYYRGEHCNWMPNEANMKELNAIENHILKGWLPTAPFITKTNLVTAFGSCFAAHIMNSLHGWGYNTATKGGQESHIITRGDGMVNTFTIRQQFEWAYKNKKFPEDVWYTEPDGTLARKDESIRLATKDLFDKTDIFIITLGLSEIWYNKKTQDVFWKAVPEGQFNPQEHGFRVSSCSENIANLETIVSIIKEFRPKAHIVFTLSPIKLLATFREVSCITADCVSKAILRASLDEAIRNHQEDKRLYYWPSYEIALSGFPQPYIEDRRHLKGEVISDIMNLFRKYYLIG